MKTTTLHQKDQLRRRLLFIVLSAVFTSIVLYNYSFLLKELIPPSNTVREFCICFGQIVFQAALLVLSKAKKEMLLAYVYAMMSISLAGAILLLPAFLLHIWVLSPWFFLVYFFSVVAYMFFLHIKEVKSISAPGWLSLSWVTYRCLVLLIILSC